MQRPSTAPGKIRNNFFSEEKSDYSERFKAKLNVLKKEAYAKLNDIEEGTEKYFELEQELEVKNFHLQPFIFSFTLFFCFFAIKNFNCQEIINLFKKKNIKKVIKEERIHLKKEINDLKNNESELLLKIRQLETEVMMKNIEANSAYLLMDENKDLKKKIMIYEESFKDQNKPE